ncbi:MAG: tetratricopeptide repeat protein [Myxococcales bacterium]
MTALLLALLLAAPERVVVVARKAEPPGLLEALRKPVAAAFRRLYQCEDEDVARGNALAAQGDPDGALREYDKARARRPNDPAIAYDRASVLLKMDPKAAPVAAAEASQALQNGDAALKPKAAYQLALATEAMGQAEDAIREYGAALALDPDDVDSKVNLELLLRTQEQRRQSAAGKPKEDKPGRQGKEQKPQPQQGDASKKQDQAQPQDPNAAPQQQPDPQQQSQEQKPQPPRPDAARPEKPVDRSEAQRLLDALRASEKQLQTWRFAKKKTNQRNRSDPEKDW